MEGVKTRTSGSKELFVFSSWRLIKLTQGAVTMEVRGLSQTLTIRTEENVFLRRRRLGT